MLEGNGEKEGNEEDSLHAVGLGFESLVARFLLLPRRLRRPI